MKILSAQQIREVDAQTIKVEPIKSIVLMERASEAFAAWFVSHYTKNQTVLIVVGAGNNGGDALAVARILYNNSYQVKVFLALPNSKGSPDYQLNLKLLPKAIKKVDSIEADFDVIIDGLLGSGLTRPIDGSLAEMVAKINTLDKDIIAIDIASGLNYDGIAKSKNIITPTYTISFQLPKLAFLLGENTPFVGDWHLVDIGLDQRSIASQNSSFNYLIQTDIRKLIKPRGKFSHKGSFGHALIVAGSYGKIGAVVLASKACLRTGVGLVTSLIPACGYEILQASVPEAMCLTSGERHLDQVKLEDISVFSAIGIGPGLGKDNGALSVLIDLLKSYQKPMVLDADAINLLASDSELLELMPEKSILTPHIGEFNRLVGKSENSLDRLEAQQAFSKKHKVIIVLKGAHTAITDVDGKVWFNSTGNSGMASAGSGDVLTGIITSLLAQGYSSLEAAQIGVYIHGKAGDLAKEKLGEPSLIASDIVKRISDAFISIN